MCVVGLFVKTQVSAGSWAWTWVLKSIQFINALDILEPLFIDARGSEPFLSVGVDLNNFASHWNHLEVFNTV